MPPRPYKPTHTIGPGAIYDVIPDPEKYPVSHSVVVVWIDGRGVYYANASKPLHWVSNPVRMVSRRDMRWLLDAGYWAFAKRRRFSVYEAGWIKQAQVYREWRRIVNEARSEALL
jgi:hypothetical protein